MNGYNVDFRFEDGLLHVLLSGKYHNERLGSGGNLFQPLIEACSAHNCKKALIDARELQVDFNTMALFRAGDDAAYATRDGLRIALLAREDMIDGFFEEVVRDRNGLVGIFTDMATACDWLQQ